MPAGLEFRDLHTRFGQQRDHDGIIPIVFAVLDLGNARRGQNFRAIDAGEMRHVGDAPFNSTATSGGIRHCILFSMDRRLFMPFPYPGHVRSAGQVAIVTRGHEAVLAFSPTDQHATDMQTLAG